ncbi:IclR family transcriptional regulator [Methylobacterium nonmethylotrophicum]|uniref:IclR family transcriptional regulator n=1 Tax=Methylobacterium nonmethylotrophicum TaxID=1141884 RepID=A0A4Z0NTK8_9HYPH|nr:IclR family transcriptional regulator [Methylobacterium nonmethylotrophicum]TGE00738.1 IclR family transcriptional regulator [Methylobacterium nonmethylotrophicum]
MGSDAASPPGTGATSRPEVPGTAAFGKFMRVLQAVADAQGEAHQGPSIARLVRATALPRPTVHRIAAALVAEGLLTEEDGALHLGPRLVSLAFRSWDGSLLRQAAREPLLRLRDSLDETVHLAVPDFGEMVYIDKLESHRTVRMASRIGTRVSLHTSAVGKAWLATLPEHELEPLLDRMERPAHTPHSITDPARLRREIAETRQRGHSLDLQENELDICCYGQALRGAGGRVLGCISVSLPKYRFEALAPGTVLAAMRACAEAVAQVAGAVRPEGLMPTA